MLATDDGPLMIPFVRAGFGAFDKQVIPIVVVGYDTSSQGKGAATLMGQGTVFTFVPV
jgi:hypothetical protein